MGLGKYFKKYVIHLISTIVCMDVLGGYHFETRLDKGKPFIIDNLSGAGEKLFPFVCLR